MATRSYKPSINSFFACQEPVQNELLAFNGDIVDVGFVNRDRFTRLRVGELRRDVARYGTHAFRDLPTEPNLPSVHPTPVELAFDRQRDTVVLWVGIAVSGVCPSKGHKISHIDTDDAAEKEIVRVVVPSGKYPEYFALVGWDETTGLCNGVPIDACHVFFFPEFRDQDANDYDQNRLQWEANVRKLTYQKTSTRKSTAKELNESLEFTYEDIPTVTSAFRRTGSIQCLESCVQMLENAVHMVGQVDADMSGLTAFLSASSVVTDPAIVEEALREMKSVWPNEWLSFSAGDLDHIYHAIRVTGVSIPYQSAIDYMRRWVTEWRKLDKVFLSEADMAAISSQAWESTAKFDAIAVIRGRRNLESRIESLMSLIEELDEAILTAGVISIAVDNITEDCKATMTLDEIKESIQADSDPGQLARITTMLWMNRLKVAKKSLEAQYELCKKKSLCRRHILHREKAMLDSLKKAPTSDTRQPNVVNK